MRARTGLWERGAGNGPSPPGQVPNFSTAVNTCYWDDSEIQRLDDNVPITLQINKSTPFQLTAK